MDPLSITFIAMITTIIAVVGISTGKLACDEKPPCVTVIQEEEDEACI